VRGEGDAVDNNSALVDVGERGPVDCDLMGREGDEVDSDSALVDLIKKRKNCKQKKQCPLTVTQSG
jgi:hypothetical protein